MLGRSYVLLSLLRARPGFYLHQTLSLRPTTPTADLNSFLDKKVFITLSLNETRTFSLLQQHSAQRDVTISTTLKVSEHNLSQITQRQDLKHLSNGKHILHSWHRAFRDVHLQAWVICSGPFTCSSRKEPTHRRFQLQGLVYGFPFHRQSHDPSQHHVDICPNLFLKSKSFMISQTPLSTAAERGTYPLHGHSVYISCI
jgi:hypothetical protein